MHLSVYRRALLSESLTEQNGKSSTVKLFVFCCFFFNRGMLAQKDCSYTSSKRGTVGVGTLKANQVELSF